MVRLDARRLHEHLWTALRSVRRTPDTENVNNPASSNIGYDTGVISGALVTINSDLGPAELSSGQKELITSATTLGALIGGLVAGMLSDFTGRKPVLAISDVIFIGGAVGQAVCHTVWSMVRRLLARARIYSIFLGAKDRMSILDWHRCRSRVMCRTSVYPRVVPNEASRAYGRAERRHDHRRSGYSIRNWYVLLQLQFFRVHLIALQALRLRISTVVGAGWSD